MAAVWIQRELTLPSLTRGFHLITDRIESISELSRIRVGIAHLFLRHTSAALALNENASPAVRRDLARWFDESVPEDAPYWTHTIEGPDDMPAHLKSALLGCAVTIPVSHGRLALGAWQGVYLCELRDRGGPRRLVVTLFGESADPRS